MFEAKLTSLPAPCPWFGLILLVLLSACQPQAADYLNRNAEIREVLMQADRDFEALAQARGIEGWMQYMAPDAARLTLGEPAIRGLDNIRAADAPMFASDSVRLRWQPVDAGVFAEGRYGFTTGVYQIMERQVDGTEQQVGQGSYLSLWREKRNGDWEIVLDGGATGPPPQE